MNDNTQSQSDIQSVQQEVDTVNAENPEISAANESEVMLTVSETSVKGSAVSDFLRAEQKQKLCSLKGKESL